MDPALLHHAIPSGSMCCRAPRGQVKCASKEPWFRQIRLGAAATQTAADLHPDGQPRSYSQSHQHITQPPRWDDKSSTEVAGDVMSLTASSSECEEWRRKAETNGNVLLISVSHRTEWQVVFPTPKLTQGVRMRKRWEKKHKIISLTGLIHNPGRDWYNFTFCTNLVVFGYNVFNFEINLNIYWHFKVVCLEVTGGFLLRWHHIYIYYTYCI